MSGAIPRDCKGYKDGENFRCCLSMAEDHPARAATSVWAGLVASADEIGGRYCASCRVGHVVGDHVTINAISEGVCEYALDPNNAEALWGKSEERVGESFSE